MVFPSGDHDGAARDPSVAVTWRASPPRAETTQMSLALSN